MPKAWSVADFVIGIGILVAAVLILLNVILYAPLGGS